MPPVAQNEIDFIGFIYAALIAAGGAMGYIKKGSVASLAMGGLSGLLAAIGAYLVTKNPRNVRVSLLVALVLSGVMGMRFIRSGKFMPAGLVTVLSLLMVFRYGARIPQGTA